MSANNFIKELNGLADPQKAKLLAGYFKTGKGQYGEGDIFLGIIVPKQRQVAKKYREDPLPELEKVLHSKIHAHRLSALIALTEKFKKAGPELKKEIYELYLGNTKYINNWDLVDLSAPGIIGGYLLDKDHAPLYALAKSPSLWERRISAIGTFMFIKHNSLDDSYKIAGILLNDRHDLIHKAVGWMLREAGKKDPGRLMAYLDQNCPQMPRTMLRYAIEKLPEEKRLYYLRKK